VRFARQFTQLKDSLSLYPLHPFLLYFPLKKMFVVNMNGFCTLACPFPDGEFLLSFFTCLRETSSCPTSPLHVQYGERKIRQAVSSGELPPSGVPSQVGIVLFFHTTP